MRCHCLLRAWYTPQHWQDRFVVVRQNFLYAFHNANDPLPTKVIFLEGCFIEVRVRFLVG